MQKLLIPMPPHFFEIAEVKCTEKYKDIDPKDICYISKDFYLSYDTDTGNITLNRDHTFTVIMIRCKCKLPCQHKHGVILFFSPPRVWLSIAYHSTVFIGKI